LSNKWNMRRVAKSQAFTPEKILKRIAELKRSVFWSLKNSKKSKYSFNISGFRKGPYIKAVGGMWNEFKRQIVGGAVTAAVAIVLSLTVNALNWSLGYEVIIDGENIGMVTDKATVYEAIDGVKTQLCLFFGEESTYEKQPVFVQRIVAEDEVSDTKALENALLANVDTMVEGYAVYVNGEALFGVSSQDAADWVFAKYKQKYTPEQITDDMVVDFCENTEVKKEFMHIALLKTPEDALEVLSDGTTELAEYTVKDNDTLWDIAENFGISVERILALNDDISDKIKAGMRIKVEQPVPLLSVRSVQTVAMTEEVPYEVEKIKDDTIYEGKSVVTQKGKEGTAKVIARVTKVNGVQTGKDVLESETVTKPVKQVEKVGTKKRPPTTGSGTFVRPTYGSLSSRYGTRWNRSHRGIDIAGSYNSDIKASDGGVVTYADWMSGYGNYVVINHENGYETAYGHCASLDVKVGDRVAKGDVIAKMGNTGRSTGTHLHFEVKKNGEYVNPLEYVGY